MTKQNTVKAYDSGYSIRVTMPKSIFDEFTKVGFAKNKHHWPLLAFHVKDENGKPFFEGYDFGFELFTGTPEEFRTFYGGPAIFESGKSNKYFTLPKPQAAELGIFNDSKLQVEVIETSKPRDNFYGKVIVYRKIWQ